MAGKFKFTPEDYQQAAIKYRSELLYLPIFGIQDTLQHMTCLLYTSPSPRDS